MHPDVGDDEFLKRLNEPAAVGGHAGVTRYLLDIYRGREDLQRAFPDLSGKDALALVRWAHIHGRREVPILDELLPPLPASMPPLPDPVSAGENDVFADPRWGVNVIGYLRAELGLGEAGRQLVRGLDAARIPLLPLEGTFIPHCRHGHDYATLGVTAATFDTTIICANPDGVWSLVREIGPEFLEDRYSIGFWWWEVEGPLPPEWLLAHRPLRELWVGSAHVAGLFNEKLSTPVRQVTLPVTVSSVPRLDRQELGLPPGFLFMFMFDYHSVFARKNPLGVIAAFRAAFPPGAGASLVIKTINDADDRTNHRRLHAAAAEHPDITVIDGYVSADRKNAMLAACDCYVSLHRAEGFGLTLAEAMYLGKPTIATGYSGNLDFMSEANSHLVGYEMRTIGDEGGLYPPTGVWAEPDVEHASRLMRAVVERPQDAELLGRRAAADIRRTHSPAAAAASLTEALAPARSRVEQASPPPALNLGRATELMTSGPIPPPGRPAGPLRRMVRRGVLRVMRPFTAHQRMLDAELLETLARHRAAARTAGAEPRSGDRRAARRPAQRRAIGRERSGRAAAAHHGATATAASVAAAAAVAVASGVDRASAAGRDQPLELEGMDLQEVPARRPEHRRARGGRSHVDQKGEMRDRHAPQPPADQQVDDESLVQEQSVGDLAEPAQRRDVEQPPSALALLPTRRAGTRSPRSPCRASARSAPGRWSAPGGSRR